MGVSVLGAFKLDHLQPVKLILFPNFSIILIFILGSPIPYYPRAKYEKKGFTQKWKRHGGFCTWGFQTGPFAACWADLVLKISHLFDFHTGESNYLLPQGEGLEIRKGIPPTVDETQGFLTLGQSNCTICSLLSWFFSKKCPPSLPLYWGIPFLITPERGRKKAVGG